MAAEPGSGTCDGSAAVDCPADACETENVIGQPRQEELLQFLEGLLSPEEIEDIVAEAMIDLSPPTSK